MPKSRKHKVNKNCMSLRISTEASVNLLHESFPLSQDLFDFLGCLPEGMKREHLKNMFNDERIDETINALKVYN